MVNSSNSNESISVVAIDFKNKGDVDNGDGDTAPSNEVLLMVQFGAGFFLLGLALAKLYKAAKKRICGDDDNDIDPETGKLHKGNCGYGNN